MLLNCLMLKYGKFELYLSESAVEINYIRTHIVRTENTIKF